MRTVPFFGLLLLPLLVGCNDVTIAGASVCDGQAQGDEAFVDAPFDADGDGYFDGSNPDCIEAYAADRLDCDDRNPEVNPGADEIPCNGIDDDCNEQTSDGGEDVDEDGVAACEDCDDADAARFPGNPEVTCNDVDDDCDAATIDAPDGDADGDSVCEDCDDADPLRAPSFAETTCNTIDDDCDAATLDAPDGDEDGLTVCEDCDDADPVGMVDGDCRCPWLGAADCDAILGMGLSQGDGHYLIDPAGTGTSYPAYCDMTTDGGGWTLGLVVSDDDVATWTYNDRARFSTDATPIGDLCMPSLDYKSSAWHDIDFSDVMFRHAPSDVWAAYDGVGDATRDVGTFLAEQPFPLCFGNDTPVGYTMTAGTLTAGFGAGNTQLCDTQLFVHPGDHEGGGGTSCTDFTRANNGPAWGFAWNRGSNSGCPLDDSASASLGTHYDNAGTPGVDEGEWEHAGLGFSGVLNLNAGTQADGAHHMRAYVR